MNLTLMKRVRFTSKLYQKFQNIKILLLQQYFLIRHIKISLIIHFQKV